MTWRSSDLVEILQASIGVWRPIKGISMSSNIIMQDFRGCTGLSLELPGLLQSGKSQQQNGIIHTIYMKCAVTCTYSIVCYNKDLSVFRTWNMVSSVFRWILRRFHNRMNWSSFIFVHQYHPKFTTVQKNIDQLQVFSFSELLRSELLSTVEHCLHASAWHCMDFGWQWQNPTSISWRSYLDPS